MRLATLRPSSANGWHQSAVCRLMTVNTDCQRRVAFELPPPRGWLQGQADRLTTGGQSAHWIDSMKRLYETVTYGGARNSCIPSVNDTSLQKLIHKLTPSGRES